MREKLYRVPLLAALLLTLLATAAWAADGAPDFTLTTDGAISCGTPTQLVITPQDGRTGDYWYHLNAVYLQEDGAYQLVIDPSSWASPYKAYQKESNEIPFTFYASGDYVIDVSMMTSTAPHQIKTKKITLSVRDPAYPTIEEVADRVAGACEGTTDFEKALWLHDWLVAHCTYDYQQLLYCNAEGALARGTGTCEAYHRAYCMLLRRVGIETGRMEGNGHVWTAAKLDGRWCQIDVTWDDNGWSAPGAAEQYLYFGLNDALMQAAHSDHHAVAGYVSDTLENNYFIRTGEVKQWSDPFAAQIQAKLDRQETSFTLPVSTAEPASTAAIEYALAAYDLSQRSWSAGGTTYALTATYAPGQLTCTAAPTAQPGGNTSGGSGTGNTGSRDSALQAAARAVRHMMRQLQAQKPTWN